MSKGIKAVESSDPREGEVDQEQLSDDFDSLLPLPGSDAHKSPQLLRTLFRGCQGIVPLPSTPKDSSLRDSFLGAGNVRG